MKTSGLILFILLFACSVPENEKGFKVEQAPAPLFRDAVFDGAAGKLS
jgi:hypothetical protein